MPDLDDDRWLAEASRKDKEKLVEVLFEIRSDAKALAIKIDAHMLSQEAEDMKVTERHEALAGAVNDIKNDVTHINLNMAEKKGFKQALIWILGIGGSIGAGMAIVWNFIKEAGTPPS